MGRGIKMQDGTRRALVTGPSGIIGFNLMEELAAQGWPATGIGRSRPPLPMSGDFRTGDLATAEGARNALAEMSGITDLFFSAYVFDADPLREIALNVALLNNTLDGLEAARAPLQHVVLYQGGKAYGAHLGPFRTPAKESDPRIAAPLFYFAQEDLLRERAAAGGYGFTVLRPNHIMGIGFGGFVNLLHYVALYAVICKAAGLPLAFPGGRGGFGALFEMTDARLLAEASLWAATAPAARGQVFNVTNGDLMRWENVWPRVARHFGLEPAQPLDIDLAGFMADKAPLWQQLKQRHGLCADLDSLANWPFASGFLSIGHDVHSSTVRIRQAGFGGCLDSEERMFALFEDMAARRLIPS